MSYLYHSRSEQRGRSENEDRGWAGNVRIADRGKVCVAAVADGVGGAANGAEVAAMTLKALLRAIRRARSSTFASEERLREWCNDWTGQLLDDVARLHPDGASTLSAVIRTEAGVAVLWVGDSPVFRVDGGQVERWYKPHTQFQELIEAGDEEEDIPPRARSSLTKSIAGYMGTGKGLLECRLHSGTTPSWLLVGSDGVFNHLDGSEIRQIVAERGESGAVGIARGLLAKSLANGKRTGKCLDNATISVLGWNQKRPKFGLRAMWFSWIRGLPGWRLWALAAAGGVLAALLVLGVFGANRPPPSEHVSAGVPTLNAGGGEEESPSPDFNPFIIRQTVSRQVPTPDPGDGEDILPEDGDALEQIPSDGGEPRESESALGENQLPEDAPPPPPFPGDLNSLGAPDGENDVEGVIQKPEENEEGDGGPDALAAEPVPEEEPEAQIPGEIAPETEISAMAPEDTAGPPSEGDGDPVGEMAEGNPPESTLSSAHAFSEEPKGNHSVSRKRNRPFSPPEGTEPVRMADPSGVGKGRKAPSKHVFERSRPSRSE